MFETETDKDVTRARELRRLRVREVSAVDRPANRRRFLVIKRKDAQPQIATPTRSDQMNTSTHSYEDLTARREAVEKLATRDDPTAVRAEVSELIQKFTDAKLRARPTLSKLEAECAVHVEHPELYELDLAAEFAGGQAVPVAPVVKTHVATERQKIEKILDQKVDAVLAASTAGITREAAWNIVYTHESELISRLNRVCQGY